MKPDRMAVEYERYINRSGDEEIMNRWQEKEWRDLYRKRGYGYRFL